jgi:hypothetical protein
VARIGWKSRTLIALLAGVMPSALVCFALALSAGFLLVVPKSYKLKKAESFVSPKVRFSSMEYS